MFTSVFLALYDRDHEDGSKEPGPFGSFECWGPPFMWFQGNLPTRTDFRAHTIGPFRFHLEISELATCEISEYPLKFWGRSTTD